MGSMPSISRLNPSISSRPSMTITLPLCGLRLAPICWPPVLWIVPTWRSLSRFRSAKRDSRRGGWEPTVPMSVQKSVSPLEAEGRRASHHLSHRSKRGETHMRPWKRNDEVTRKKNARRGRQGTKASGDQQKHDLWSSPSNPAQKWVPSKKPQGSRSS